MADLKTTKEARAWLRDYASGELSKAQTEGLLDDLDTLEAENAALRAKVDDVASCARQLLRVARLTTHDAAEVADELVTALEALEEP